MPRRVDAASVDAALVDGGPIDGRILLFEDSLESGDLTHQQNGVRWSSRNTGSGDSVQVTTDRAHTGTSAVQFHFAGGSSSDDAFAELRFLLGEPRTDLYVGFWIYFPDGTEPGENRYVHRDADGPDNKLLRVWAPDYNGFKWGASMRPSAGGTSYVFGRKTSNGECGTNTGTISDSSWSMSADDLGQWMHWEIHIRGDDGSGNGTYELRVDGVLVVSLDAIDVEGAPCAPNHFIAGYLLGWTNSGLHDRIEAFVNDGPRETAENDEPPIEDDVVTARPKISQPLRGRKHH